MRKPATPARSEEHTSELQSHVNLVCRLLLEKKKSARCRCALPPNGRRRQAGSTSRANRDAPSFLFLMIRRPPRSTPFPTRRSSDLRERGAVLRDRLTDRDRVRVSAVAALEG